ncbi:MAG: DUF2783 domain-containing protein [Limnohabitans sp.]|jgi:hypothetical protein
MTSSPTPSISIPELEVVYDSLATAIDQVGQEKASLFLVKLALLNANALGRADIFQANLQAALRDL